MIALVPTPPPPLQRDFARIQSLALEAGLRADGALRVDLDGDGLDEVVLAVHQEGKPFARSLETWRQDPQGGLVRASTLALTSDVVAFAFADVRAGGGAELLLFNAGGVFLWHPGPEARPERLLAAEFLWQAADPEQVFEWSGGVRDLDGDGLSDLVVPEPGGYLVALQRRTADPSQPWGVLSRLRAPPDPGDPGVWAGATKRRGGVESKRSNGSFSLGLRVSGDEDSEEDGGTLVSVEERVPAPTWLDWDADTDLDLLLLGERHLHVWLQEEGGRFSADPRPSLALPLPAGSRELDTASSAHAVDLDRDQRADCVLFAGDKRADSLRAQALFFTQATRSEPLLFGPEGRPANLLVFAGFVVDPGFDDLDGDGYPELVVRTIRPDLIDQIQSALSESIEADLYVYRNRRGVLARKPELARRHAIQLEEFELASEFIGDLSGDGLAELFVRDAPEKLRLLMLRAQGQGEQSTWSLLEKPLWELNVAKEARVEVARKAGARASLFVFEPTQVLWVRFE